MPSPRQADAPGIDDLDELADLLEDWRIHLRAKNLRPDTIKSYLTCANNLLGYLREKSLGLRKASVEAFLGDMQERVKAATVAKHYRSLQQLAKWLHAEGEIGQNPMAGMTAPEVPEQPVPVLTDADLTKLLDTCKGATFENRRDAAIIRVLDDGGMRAGELVGLGVEDIDREAQVFHVMGKGGRGRAVPYGTKTSEAVRRYLRARARHPLAGRSDRLWLGKKGPLTDSGVRQLLERRAKDAGLDHLHPHLFRHTFAHTWLANGGQEQDLMMIAGWRSREMVGRYGRSAAAARAREAHRRMALGDRL